MTVFESVTPLELERTIFDSSEVRILAAAFQKAWVYVEFDPLLDLLDSRERKSELARCLMTILKLGETNPISLANAAIALLRKSQESSVGRRRLRIQRHIVAKSKLAAIDPAIAGAVKRGTLPTQPRRLHGG